MPTANVRDRALGGKGATKFGNFWSGTWEYHWHSLHGITRLRLIVSASTSGELLFLLLLREPGTGEFCVPFFTTGISLLTSAP